MHIKPECCGGFGIMILYILNQFSFLFHYFGVMNCVSTFCSQQNPNVERQHAIIEYDESQGCFVVQDLNSAHGTYINDCRVQNAAVRLAPGDVVRFGYRIL